MKKIVLFFFALALSFSLSAQTVIFHFIVNMDSAKLGFNDPSCVRPFDTATDDIEILGTFIDNWVSPAPWTHCTDPIVPLPAVDFVHIPNTLSYTRTDTITDSSNSNFTMPGVGQDFAVQARINHTWDNVDNRNLAHRSVPVPLGAKEVTAQWIFGDTSQLSVVFSYIMATGVKNIAAASITSLAPNPATGKTTLTYTAVASGTVQISIINLLGQKIRTVLNTQQTAGVHVQPINVSDLPDGVYFMNINVNGSTLAHKFSVVN